MQNVNIQLATIIRSFLRAVRIGLVAIAILASPNCFAEAGNVVWRDLNVPGLGRVGHIGMDTFEYRWDKRNKAWGPLFLEALNEAKVIVKKTRLRAIVWSPHERYYATCEGCYHDWRSVIAAGWEQRNWSPSYSYSASYREGKIVLKGGKWVRQTAKYRCDSFVTYSYMKGLGLDISQRSQTPRNVWLGFPYHYTWNNAV